MDYERKGSAFRQASFPPSSPIHSTFSHLPYLSSYMLLFPLPCPLPHFIPLCHSFFPSLLYPPMPLPPLTFYCPFFTLCNSCYYLPFLLSLPLLTSPSSPPHLSSHLLPSFASFAPFHFPILSPSPPPHLTHFTG